MDVQGLHLLLLLFLFAMYALGVAYLRRRRMSFEAFAFWGLVAMFVPVFGPFFVIALKPGRPATLSAPIPHR